jgi:hypothetical protein
MTDKPKRRWFHFHLFTAVVPSIAIALALFQNMVAWGQTENKSTRGTTFITYHGWPFWSWTEKRLTGFAYTPPQQELPLSAEHARRREEDWKASFPEYTVIIQEWNLAYDIAIGTAFFAAVTSVAEYLFRSRDARRQ